MRILGMMVVLILLGGRATPASAIEMTASVDNSRPREGEQIVLEVVITGSVRNPGEPVLPNLEPEFRVFSSGSSRNISIVNGHMTSALTYSYVLIPQKTGSLRIGPVTLTRKNEVLRTDPITIRVGPTGRPPAGVDPGNASGNEDLFVRATLDSKRLYVGEQGTLKLQLYARVQLLETPTFGPPDMDGFWREDLPAVRPRIVTVSGQRYRLLEVSLAVFPTRSGSLSIGAATIVATIRGKRPRRDPFSVFGSIFNGKRVSLRTKPIPVEVLPLPDGAPLGFNGAVGDYVLEVEADPRTVEQGNPIHLLIQLSGTGNLRSVPEIPLPELPGYRVYPEAPEVASQTHGVTVSGTLTQQVLLVPLTAGEQTIPAIRMPAFSPRGRTYKTLESRPISVTVTPQSAGSDGLAGVGRQSIEVIGNDIRFIETECPEFRDASDASKPLTGILLLPLPVVLYAGAWWMDRRRKRLESNVALKRKSRAYKSAMKRLKTLEQENSEDPAGEAVSVLQRYLGDRWNLQGVGLTQEGIAERLRREGKDPEALTAFLEGCDAERFAPGTSDRVRRRVLGEVRTWIDRLERGA